MEPNKNELKLNSLNNSMQFSQKLFNPNLLLTDYNINNENENRINNKNKMNKKNHFSSKLYKKNNITDKNKIVVNYNYSKINQNIVPKNIFPDKTKNPGIPNNIKSREKNNKSKKAINNERNMNNSLNGKIVPYSSHTKEIKDLKHKTKKNKNSESNEKYFAKNKNSRKNRNLNLTLTDFLSMSGMSGTEYKKIEKDNKIYNLNKSPEILIKKKFINTTKNKLDEKIFGRMNLNNNNFNENYSNVSNNNINNKSNLSNKATNNSLTHSAAKRKMNKRYNLQSNDNVLKINQKYSINKKLDNVKHMLNEQIIDIINSYNKIINITDKDNIKKNQLIFDIIQNSFFKFITLLENPKEKEIAFDIMQKLNDFFKKQDNIINNIIKKNEDLNEKIKKYKDINKNIEKENLQLIDKCDIMEKKIEEMENNYKNNFAKNRQYNDTDSNLNIISNNLFANGYNDSNGEEDEEDESSVNTEELESIRFFDKIIMKKHSFSKAHIPELEIKQIKLLNNEQDNKENIKINNKYKYNNFYKNKYNKGFRNGLKKIVNKSTKTFGYTKIAADKKKINGKKFHK